MLHMVIVRHTAESCPGRPENRETVLPCANSMRELSEERRVTTVGSWADPPGHVTYMVLEAPSAHTIQELLMESGLASHTTSEIRPVLSTQ